MSLKDRVLAALKMQILLLKYHPFPYKGAVNQKSMLKKNQKIVNLCTFKTPVFMQQYKTFDFPSFYITIPSSKH